MVKKQLAPKNFVGRCVERCSKCRERAPDFVLKNGLCFQCEEREMKKSEIDKLVPKW
jgi:hypothetical protein